MTTIALAIFASLAGFVFLPFGMAIALTAVVTIGAIVCCDESTPPPAPPQTFPPTMEVLPDGMQAELTFSDESSVQAWAEQARKMTSFGEYTSSVDLATPSKVVLQSTTGEKIDTEHLCKCLREMYKSNPVQIVS
jgi:hypothetical protein